MGSAENLGGFLLLLAELRPTRLSGALARKRLLSILILLLGGMSAMKLQKIDCSNSQTPHL